MAMYSGPATMGQASMMGNTPAVQRANPVTRLGHYAHPKGGYPGGRPRPRQNAPGRAPLVPQGVRRPAVMVSAQPPQMQPSQIIGMGMLRGK